MLLLLRTLLEVLGMDQDEEVLHHVVWEVAAYGITQQLHAFGQLIIRSGVERSSYTVSVGLKTIKVL